MGLHEESTSCSRHEAYICNSTREQRLQTIPGPKPAQSNKKILSNCDPSIQLPLNSFWTTEGFMLLLIYACMTSNPETWKAESNISSWRNPKEISRPKLRKCQFLDFCIPTRSIHLNQHKHPYRKSKNYQAKLLFRPIKIVLSCYCHYLHIPWCQL